MTDCTHLIRQANLVAGDWIVADKGRTLDGTSPESGAVIGCVPVCGAAETRRAFDAAHTAFPPVLRCRWGKWSD